MQHYVKEFPVAISSYNEKRLFALGCIDGHVKLMSFESIGSCKDVEGPNIKVLHFLDENIVIF